jgi:3-oxoacyl-[acyl-carrier-protein] synthase-3
MDGPGLVRFTFDVVPPLVEQLLHRARWSRDDVDLYLMHQATSFLLDHLRIWLKVDAAQLPAALHEYGNTVSSTLPFLIDDLRRSGRLQPGKHSLLVGFGVGFSWAGCAWVETWEAHQSQAGWQKAA